MNYNKYTIQDENSIKEIYPLLEININNKEYLIYSEELLQTIDKDKLYIGEVINNELYPVDEKLLPEYDKFIDELIMKLQNNSTN